MIAFSYFGGKNSHLGDILPLLPACEHYVEPFAGSAAVLLNRYPSPIETISDLNGDIVNFFQVVRDSPDELFWALSNTPYSREEFMRAWEHTDDSIERARRWYIRVSMDIAKAGAKKDRSWSVNVKYCAGAHSSAVNNFFSKIQGFSEISARLLRVQIENRNALKIIEKYDTPDTLFYCDPPYLHETRTSKHDYCHEMKLQDHQRLSEILNSVKGKVALSGYNDPIMAELYPVRKWKMFTFKEKQLPMSKGNGRKKQEVLWTNYDPFKNTQIYLFD